MRPTITRCTVGLARLRLVTYERVGIPLTGEMRAFRASWLGSKATSAQP